MLLSGEMLLRHEGHHEQRLRAFEQDRFDGAWNTTSFGRAVDFNLMMAQGVEGDIVAMALVISACADWNLANAALSLISSGVA